MSVITPEEYRAQCVILTFVASLCPECHGEGAAAERKPVVYGTLPYKQDCPYCSALRSAIEVWLNHYKKVPQ